MDRAQRKAKYTRTPPRKTMKIPKRTMTKGLTATDKMVSTRCSPWLRRTAPKAMDKMANFIVALDKWLMNQSSAATKQRLRT